MGDCNNVFGAKLGREQILNYLDSLRTILFEASQRNSPGRQVLMKYEDSIRYYSNIDKSIGWIHELFPESQVSE